MRRHPHVVFLCTGNAARSVMAGAMLAAHRVEDVRVTTAGTHVIEGQPMSRRTRDAMAELGVATDGHRSRQLRQADVDSADLLIGLATEHVSWARRFHPEAAGRTATLRRLWRDLPGEPSTLAERVDRLKLAEIELEAWEDVEDPAGGEAEEFGACAREVMELVAGLAPRLGTADNGRNQEGDDAIREKWST